MIQAFLAFARTPDQTFSVAISGEFEIGSQDIAYEMTGVRSGRDVMESGTETIDGVATPFGIAFIGGHLFAVEGGHWSRIATGADASQFARVLLSFRSALVLEDLGTDVDTGTHRLRVSAGISLFPPQMTTDAVPDAHDAAERLELLVTDQGLPVEALYTRSFAGTIDGAEGTARGSVRFAFGDIGGRVEIPALSLAPGQTMPPSVSPSPVIAADWQILALSFAPYAIELPGIPVVTSGSVANPNLGDRDQSIARLTATTGATYSAIEVAVPSDYVQERGADAVAEETIAGEAKNLGATVVGQRPLEGSEVAGLDAILATNTTLYRVRVYVFPDDVLELVVAGDMDAVANTNADRFLSSVAPRR